MRTERIVIDTNILISSFLLKKSISRDAFEKAKHEFVLVASIQTFSELKSVLLRPKFDNYISMNTRLQIIEDFGGILTFLEPKTKLDLCRDPKDNKFLELANESQAKLLISGDKDLLELEHNLGFRIVNPSEFLQSI